MSYLIVTAHPDDETLYFGGLIASHPERHWHVICVTDGNAAGAGAERATQFRTACERLGVARGTMLAHRDDPNVRLNVDRLIADLYAFPDAEAVYTHGVLGDYGHPHHQDVSYAVHQAYGEQVPVFSVASHIAADQVVALSEAAYSQKTEVLREVYGMELRKLVPLLAVAPVEALARVSAAESAALYRLLSQGERPDETEIVHHRWLLPLLNDDAVARQSAAFFEAYFASAA